MIGKSNRPSVKKSSSDLRRNKQLRRKWLTFVRMCRYGVNNFSRNAWLTIAATAVMTITLLIIFATLVARMVLLSTVDDLQKKVDISIYLKDSVTKETVDTLTAKLNKLPSVAGVEYITIDEARKEYIQKNKPSVEELDSLAELDNPFPPILRVNPTDLNNLKSIEGLVTNDDDFQDALSQEHTPSFAGERRASINNIGKIVSFAEKSGLAASGIFIAISILIIFNTIRMAIFNRKEEIEMMKLIGAEKSFIQGPFIVEAVMYGFFAAIIAFVAGFVGLTVLRPKLEGYGIAISGVYEFVVAASAFIIVGLIVIGALIGVISSFFAVRKHLKI
jgi:cell division transport system permease protein